MKVMTSRVVDGKITVEPDLQDGTVVAILAADEFGFALTGEEEDELSKALEAIRGGSYTDGRKLLQDLKTPS